MKVSVIMSIDSEQVETELKRVRAAIAGAPQYSASALYAAQQALAWTLDPQTYRSPFAAITGTSEASADC